MVGLETYVAFVFKPIMFKPTWVHLLTYWEVVGFESIIVMINNAKLSAESEAIQAGVFK